MNRHAKASSARSTQRQAGGLGCFMVGVLVALALIPASASAVTTHPVTGFSPITGAGTGVSFNFPTGIAVDESNGNVFVNDGFPNEATDIFDAEGGVPVGVASPYQITGFDFFFSPAGVAVDNSATSPSKGTLYVTDVRNSKLKKFVRNGGTELYEAAGELTPGSGPAFNEPLGVAVDSKGNVFVADYGSSSVVEFSPTGTQLARIDTTATVGRPGTLAFDAAGDLFVQSYSNGSVHKYTANGSGEIEEAVHTQVVPSGASGVAVDSATNSLFVVFADHVNQYDATSLAYQVEFGAGVLASAQRIAVNSTTGNIYVSDNGNTNVAVFGNGVKIPGASPRPVTGLSGSVAMLNAVVNPDGVAVAECKFEYGTTAAYGTTKPCEGPIPTDSADHPVSASLSGLDPHTTYHWRIVVNSANGANESPDQSFKTLGPEVKEAWTNDVAINEATVKAKINPGGQATTYHVEYGTDTSYGQSTAEKNAGADEADHTVAETLTGLDAGTTYYWRVVATNAAGSEAGPDRSFITELASSSETNCPNQQFRSGASANLPDCRAYEMVSPVDKKGGNIFTKGDAFNAFWAALNQSSVSGNKFTYSSYRAFGDAQSAPQSSQYLATRTADGWSNHGISPPHAAVPFVLASFFLEPEYRVFTPDLSAGVFMYNDEFLKLTPDATPAKVPTIFKRDLTDGDYDTMINADTGLVPPAANPYPEPHAISADGKHIVFGAGNAPLTPDASTAGNPQTYEWSNGQLHLVSVLPDGTASTNETEAGFGNNEGKGETHYGNVVHAVSEDGSLVFWTDWAGPTRVYLRKNAQAEQSTSGCEAEKACTIQVSGASFASFLAADPNGTRAIYRENGGLWEFDVATETRSLIAPELAEIPIGTSEDLSRIYLVSRANLAAGATAGEPNLYLAEEGVFTFIATLSDADLQGMNSVSQAPAWHTGRVTPDGGNVAFMSSASLSTVNFPDGYDNTDSATGMADSEVYTYDADSGELTCASCRPSGARPSGGQRIVYGANEFGVEAPIAAAWINAWSMQYYGQRALSDDGDRLFFNAYDALLPQDTNGKQDVYQWEAQGSGSCQKPGGCLSLISTGKSPESSEFFDASPSGDDVFIRTLSSLVPQDNGLVDIYDARVNGGFPQPSRVAACEGETCQSTPAALNDPTPASSAYRGPGNVVEKPARKSKKKKHHKAKKKQRKKQSRAANNSRRAHR